MSQPFIERLICKATTPLNLIKRKTAILTSNLVSSSGQTYAIPQDRLSQRDLHPSHPTPQFLEWLSAARAAPFADVPEYCTLSTAELPSGRVSSRIVQLKGLEADGGFILFSNLDSSRKSNDLVTNPHASLVFYWGSLQRQVLIEGVVKHYSDEEKADFFATTARQSRIASWAKQSLVVPQVDDSEDDGGVRLEEWMTTTEKRYADFEEVPMAPSWGVIRIVPTRVEFWQAGRLRLHDRFAYEWDGGDDGVGGTWKITRLYP